MSTPKGCLNQHAIEVQNDGWQKSFFRQEAFSEAAVILLLQVRPDLADQIGDPDILEARYREAQESLRQQRQEYRLALVGRMTCDLCEGPVMDSRNGDIYCGLEVPEIVLKANQLRADT